MLYYKGVEDSVKWYDTAKPNPSTKDISTQIGVHFEEFAEFMETLNVHGDETIQLDIWHKLMTALTYMEELAGIFKTHDCVGIEPSKRVEALDALCDTIVTATGVAHSNSMNIIAGLNEVNRSNFSKFDENGLPVLDSNRKIIKGNNYTKPNLTTMV